ncbi:MAG TPA: polysaccharide deacetylase family protein [Candidatus Acidoferrum sp.]|jgi:peptidoglycan/xylan/chitin deacetylase (PgdA/CDA1 family)|nr:polysaccharide deacetylase family protein [Candidatus Acidoferrum sp.]
MKFLLLFVVLISVCRAQKVAITFDDLPLNGELPPGMTRVEITRETLAVLKNLHIPPAYGFVNAKKLKGNADAAEALKLWAAAEPFGNHTYSHINLSENPAEAFEREILQNEPALELLAGRDVNWHWLRYPFLHEGDTLDSRRAVRAYLQAHGYRIAQVTLDWEDYLWNSAYARCIARNDAQSIAWLRSSYLGTEAAYVDLARQLAAMVYGHEINHVLLLHLGAFSRTILPDALDLLQKKGFTFVTLDEAQSDPAYRGDPDVGSKYGGTMLELWMEAKKMKFPPVMEKPYKQIAEICK